ncbi:MULTISPECIES: hypothetical protein [Gordonia]|nr:MULTISPECIES: hypothetical protein [Gordonia]WLP89613.1 hypothetical protein Q9K23_18940 [Gordonia sp. NB41Y]
MLKRIAVSAAGVLALAVAPVAAGVAAAAPDSGPQTNTPESGTPSPAAPDATVPGSTAPTQPAVRQLDVSNQTPTIGITRVGILPTGGFVAPLAAAATGTDTTVVWLEPMPGNACATSLRTAKVAVSWKNTSTHKADDATFPACTSGKPTISPALPTGAGTLSLTVTVLGDGGNTVTLSPGIVNVNR